MRTSDRVFLEIPILAISGTDPSGRAFVENTQALVLSRRGARIISRAVLWCQQQKLDDRCLKTGLDTEARVVGPIMGKAEGCHFGVAFLHPEINVWGINFPLTARRTRRAGCFWSAQTATRRRLCTWTFLNWRFFSPMHASRVLAAMQSAHLVDAVRAREEPIPRHVALPPPPYDSGTQGGLASTSRWLFVSATPMLGQEIASTENVSRGGFRIISRKDYPVGTVIEAALPIHPEPPTSLLPPESSIKSWVAPRKHTVHGVAYIPSPVARSWTGSAITLPK